MILIFMILLLAHFIGDFLIQPKTLVDLKAKRVLILNFFNKGLLYHSLCHLCLSIIALIIVKNFNYYTMTAVTLIVITHYIIDLLKVKVEKSIRFRQMAGLKNSTIFLFDQIIHIIVIYLILYLLNLVSEPGVIFEQMSTFLFAQNLTMEIEIKVVSFLIMFIILTSGSSYFIGAFLKDIAPLNTEAHKQEAAATIENIIGDLPLRRFKDQVENTNLDMVYENSYQVTNEADNSNKITQTVKVQYNKYQTNNSVSTGRYIGILERILISMLVILNLYQGLVLVGAIKTLTRFKQFEDRNFAEYYLFGTLLSLVFGLVCGWSISRII